MAGKACHPPTSVSVKGYSYTRGKRKKKRAPRKTPKSYWYSTNGHERCSHHHRGFTGAHACANRMQRIARRKYGRKSGGTWTTRHVKG